MTIKKICAYVIICSALQATSISCMNTPMYGLMLFMDEVGKQVKIAEINNIFRENMQKMDILIKKCDDIQDEGHKSALKKTGSDLKDSCAMIPYDYAGISRLVNAYENLVQKTCSFVNNKSCNRSSKEYNDLNVSIFTFDLQKAEILKVAKL